ncbi:hypothetical protein HU200_031573 [Digitaria exilis]|uniref:Lunapark domain-containing protein n=1 Tax=Digitaria exilis TaxID=1010633 RepID=A0A835BLU3_9POAL|nr:hypothetical protein HU200_031573 [Digitaria exilis]
MFHTHTLKDGCVALSNLCTHPTLLYLFRADKLCHRDPSLIFREANPCLTASAALKPNPLPTSDPAAITGSKPRAMASSAEAAEMVASAAAAAASEAKRKEGEEKREGAGILGRIWRALFGGRGEDYETRLQNLSKEEAAVLARMRRRAQFSRHGVRNLIALSVLGEVGAVVYAIIMTRSEDLDWRIRAIKVLPIFLLPALSSMIYSLLVSFTRMCKYLRTLLRIFHIYPPSALIGHHKVFFNSKLKYKLELSLIYHNDCLFIPLCTVERKDKNTLERLRAERKAKIDELKDRTNYYLTQELIQKYDLDSAAKAAAASVLASKMGAETGLKNWMHCMIRELAGLARKEDFPHVTYYCPHCHALNLSNQSIGQCSSSDSCQLSPVAPADGVSTTHPITETELSSTIEVQELSEEANAGKQPVEPAN